MKNNGYHHQAKPDSVSFIRAGNARHLNSLNIAGKKIGISWTEIIEKTLPKAVL
jgi:uncharacterized protein YxeA